MKKLLFALACLATSAFSKADVLYWMVDDSVTVDGGDVYTFVSFIPDDENNWPAARVMVTGGNLEEPVYLGLYYGPGEVWSGDEGVYIGDNGGGYWGAGAPVGNQSPIGNEILEECLFTMQIGRDMYDETADTVSWITLAESDPVTRSALAQYIYQEFDISPPTTGIWTPDFHATPEPNSMTLFLIGTAALCLRRKREIV